VGMAPVYQAFKKPEEWAVPWVAIEE